jgi:hypothetical protein
MTNAQNRVRLEAESNLTDLKAKLVTHRAFESAFLGFAFLDPFLDPAGFLKAYRFCARNKAVSPLA